MNNFDVLFAKSLSKGGGGSGTDNYNELSNKPQINGNALTGNKTGANLGLQDAITSESKLSSDLVDDTGAENLFVSSTEKSTWGGKQDPATTLSGYGITDTYTKTETGTQITNAIGALDVSSVGGSGKYISAISETDGKISATAETMDTTPTSGSEKAVTSGAVYTALASKQDALSQAQLAAANSGITAEKLTVDEAALAEVVNNGAKNIADMSKTSFTLTSKDGVQVSLSGDTITSIGTGGTLTNNFFNIYYRANTVLIPPGTWVATLSGSGIENFRCEEYDDVKGTAIKGEFGEPFQFTVPDNVNLSYLRITSKPSTNCAGTFKLMICPKAAWDASHEYQPYAPTNRELYEMILALQNGGNRSLSVRTTEAEPEEIRTDPDEIEPETGEEEMR